MQLRTPEQQSTQRYVTPRRAVRAKLPCFLCSADLEIRTDKNGKRYFICDECGVQAFVRRKAGISRLAKLVRGLRRRNSKLILARNSSFEVFSLVSEIGKLKGQIKNLRSKTGFFSTDADKKRVIAALEARVSALLSTLEKRAGDVRPFSQQTKNIS